MVQFWAPPHQGLVPIPPLEGPLDGGTGEAPPSGGHMESPMF